MCHHLHFRFYPTILDLVSYLERGQSDDKDERLLDLIFRLKTINASIYWDDMDNREVISSLMRPKPTSTCFLIVSNHPSQVSGYAITEKKGDTQTLDYLAIDPRYQKQGFGTMLLNKVMALAKRRGAARLWLMCEEKLLPFYQKYAKKSKTPLFTGNRRESIRGDITYDVIYELSSR